MGFGRAVAAHDAIEAVFQAAKGNARGDSGSSMRTWPGRLTGSVTTTSSR
jgi:hypothetical protein